MEKKIDFAIGGQALIEGIMMRSPHFVSIAVRKQSGEIVSKVQEKIPLPQRLKMHKVPIIRGILGVFDMMVTGIKALDFASQVYIEDAEERVNEAKSPKTKMRKFLEGLSLAVSLLISLGMAFVLFKLVPLYLTEFLRSHFDALKNHYVLFNLTDGLIRICIFFAYIGLLFIFKSFRRVFEFHGAEHMAVHTYEAHEELTPDNVKKHTPEHPRCGTSFLMAVLIISILVFSLVPRHPEFILNLLIRTSVMPLIAGIGYEFLKWSAKYVTHPLMKLVVVPGIVTQYITTQKPHADQIEVAIVALQNALDAEEKRAKPKTDQNNVSSK